MKGYILKDSVVLFTARYWHDVPIRELRQEITTTVERLHLIALLEQLLQSQKQNTIIIDEYSDLAGLDFHAQHRRDGAGHGNPGRIGPAVDDMQE